MTTEVQDYWISSLGWSWEWKFLEVLGQATTVFHSKVTRSIDLKLFSFSLVFTLIKSKVKIMFQKKKRCCVLSDLQT